MGSGMQVDRIKLGKEGKREERESENECTCARHGGWNVGKIKIVRN